MSKINKLQLDLLKRHAGPFAFCFLTVMFLLLMQFLILYIDRLVGKGLPFGIIAELIATNLAYMVVLAAPMATLVACLMAFGKFSELNELTALRAAGINPIHTINPVLIAATIMALFLMWFSNYVLPDANQRARSLFIDIRTKKPGFDLQPNEFYEGINGYIFLVKEMDSETDSLYDVTLFQEPSSEKNKAIIKADRGILESIHGGQMLNLRLNDGSVMRYMERRQGRESTSIIEKTEFERYRISFDLSELAFSRSNPNQRSRHDRTMNIQSMLTVVDSLERDINEERQMIQNNTKYIVSDTIGPPSRSRINPPDFVKEKEDTSSAPYQSDFLVLDSQESRKFQDHLRMKTLQSLREYKNTFDKLESTVQWRTTQIARYLVEIHKKFSIPIACIIFVLIGAPIGMYTRKGNLGYAALISAGFLTFYWISIIQGEKLADRLFISPEMGMWFSNVLLGIIGTYLTVRFCTSFKISNLWKKRD